ncbi:translation initiation factor IF-2-like [Cebus imitator]|uniref:translation initiation factor IF-2-like n=1 Tax=Cebus imitator TaxID=2715852 RepID=UPI0018991FFC|nr:translation initiation factor IF-2-like [Cebus imitator]
MSLPNPILQWNSGYLQTDFPALQVSDEIRSESPFFYGPVLGCTASRPRAAAPVPHPGRAPGPRPAQDAAPPGPELAEPLGLRAGLQQVTLTASPRVRGRPTLRPGFWAQPPGAGEGVWPGFGWSWLRGPGLGSPEGRLRRRWAPEHRGRRLGASATQEGEGGGFGGSPRHGLQDGAPKRGTPRPLRRWEPAAEGGAPPSALLLQPELRSPIPARRASSPGARGRKNHTPQRRSRRHSPRRPGGAAHPPLVPRSAPRPEPTDLCSCGRLLRGWKDNAGLTLRRHGHRRRHLG